MEILEIANKIKENNGILYRVGGAVRDQFIGRENHDEDYVVTGIGASKFVEIFPESFKRGKSFEVFELDGKEFALARKERKIGKGHTSFEIDANPQITIEEDLERRDITINSIAINVLTNEIIDPFNGREDIKAKIIRKTSTHFKEDPLRVYRVARFAAELGFDVSEDTILEMNYIKKELETLSAERVFNEFRKALLSDNPSKFFDVLKNSDVLDVHFKEVYDLIGVEQPIKYHPEGDVYNHTMLVLEMTTQNTKDLLNYRKEEIRFAALVHDFGKALTPKSEYPHHYNHEKNGIVPIKNFCKRLKCTNRMLKCGITACQEHMRGGIFDKMKPGKKVEFIERVNDSILGLDGLQIIVNSDRLSNKHLWKKDEEIYSEVNFERIGKILINSVSGKIVKEMYNIEDGILIKNKIHDERIKLLKRVKIL